MASKHAPIWVRVLLALSIAPLGISVGSVIVQIIHIGLGRSDHRWVLLRTFWIAFAIWWSITRLARAWER
jgi:hypothetical protein